MSAYALGRSYAFPTCVGMNRGRRQIWHDCSGVPHVRGDEPVERKVADVVALRSPRAWG